jgi:CRP-like cAMP-binding protein
MNDKAGTKEKPERRKGERREQNKGTDGSERRVGGSDRRRTKRSKSSGLDRRTIHDGHFVFREGELGEQAYIITVGTVEIVKSTGTGEMILGTVSKGGIFGEMALIDDSQRMASARATDGPVEVMIITRKTFASRMEKMDPFTRALINIFAEHIRSLASALGEAKTRAS